MKADLLYSLRSLGKSPLFVAVGVASLALGIGANTAVFSMMDKILLESLPVERPRELVQLRQTGTNYGRADRDNAFSYPMLRDLRQDNRVFAGLLAHATTQVAFRDGESTLRANADIVTGDFFETLGIRPRLGRLLTMEDEQTPNGHPVVVISYAFWRSRFGGDASVLGRSVHVNNYPMTIVGVAEPGFNTIEVGQRIDLWAPIMMKEYLTPTWGHLDDRRYVWLHIFARMKPGVTREQATAQLQPVFAAYLDREFQELPAAVQSRIKQRWFEKTLVLFDGHRGTSAIRDSLASPLTALMIMVAMVLLIACANLASLLLARAASRRKEVAIRLSLGASRAQIVRQMLTESAIIAIAGGAAGLLIAWWTVEMLAALVDGSSEAAFTFIDGRVLLFTLALSLLTAILFGLAPALQSTRDVVPALKDDTAGQSSAHGHVRIRRALVAAQVALSLFLLVGAGLFARTLANLKDVDAGFRTENLVQFELDASLNGYAPAAAAQFYTRLQNALAGRPGIASVSFSDGALLSEEVAQTTIAIPGFQPAPGFNMNPTVLNVGPGFFETTGLPLRAGRSVASSDVASGPHVAVVNEAFVRAYFPNVPSAVGQTFHRGRVESGRPPIQIVGVVADSKYGNLREEPRRMYYRPHVQDDELGRVVFYLRADRGLQQIASMIRSEVRALDPNLPVNDLRRLEVTVDRLLAPERLTALLSTIFGVLATLLAAMGLYGVMAYNVARRTREIGIRIALGAERRSVVWLVMRESARLTVIGLAIGVPAALIASRFIEGQLYGAKGADIGLLLGAAAILGGVTVLAGFSPALRAVRIDPIRALRYE